MVHWKSLFVLGATLLRGSLASSEAQSEILEPQLKSQATDDTSFDWMKIDPKISLEYHPCYGKYQCARLDVPMNYNRTDGNGSRVAIAILKAPAKVNVTDPRYGGAILVNPGGPGVPGTGLLLRRGDQLQTVINGEDDDPTSKFFDIIGWDPRGVGNTTPALLCFTDPQERLRWQHVSDNLPYPDPNDVSGTFDLHLARFTALGASCSSKLLKVGEDEDALVENIGTSHVVGDMVSIIEAHGEWRERQARQLLSSRASREPPMRIELRSEIVDSKESILERTKWQRGAEKINYWGMSYGTIIGQTFATINPHLVGKLILDGVGNIEEYYETLLTGNLLIHTDKVLDQFFEVCAAAGPSKCPFVSLNSAAYALKHSWKDALDGLTLRPIPVFTSDAGSDMFGVVTANDLRVVAFMALYQPLQKFDELATILHDLRRRNGTSLYKAKMNIQAPAAWQPPADCTGDATIWPVCNPQWSNEDVGMAIMCNDANRNDTPVDSEFEIGRDWVLERWQDLRNQSSLVGNYLASMPMQCLGWKAKTTWPFKPLRRVETANPLLVVTTSYDPIAPPASAQSAIDRFVGSALLVQDSIGHCALSAPSICTAQVIRRYFNSGELPDVGKVCDVDEIPFLGRIGKDHIGDQKTSSGKDHELFEALRALQDVVTPLFGRFP